MVKRLLMFYVLLCLASVTLGNLCSESEDEGKWTITMSVEGQGTTDTAGVSSWRDGDNVTVTATAKPFWRFSSWSGDASGTENPFTFEIEGNMTFVALFVPNTQTRILIDDTIEMAPMESYFDGYNAYGVPFAVDIATIRDITVFGTFMLTSASPEAQVDVLVLDAANYSALKTGGNWMSSYSSGPRLSGNVDFRITNATEDDTTFYLALVVYPTAVYSGPVYVQANIALSYTAYS